MYTFQAKDNGFTIQCSGSEAGSYSRLIDSCITQLKVQGPSRTCNESKKEEEEGEEGVRGDLASPQMAPRTYPPKMCPGIPPRRALRGSSQPAGQRVVHGYLAHNKHPPP